MKKKISLKWKIARYLAVFACFILIVLGVFQFLLLQPMYEDSRINTVKEVADDVTSALEEDDLGTYIYESQATSDTCIMVYQDGSRGRSTVDTGNMGCMLYRLKPVEVASYVANAANSTDGTYLAKTRMDFQAPGSDDQFENIIYTKIVSGDTDSAVVMVSAGVSPISAAIQTLHSQMLWITILIIIAICILTFALYKQIAKPLAEINTAAKSLPSGKYELNPKTNRYQEAEELNGTLVHAAEDIRKADKAKRDLISNVSHDLRTPLTMISGYGEMMRDLPEEKTDENLQVIIDESKRLNNLVNDLLDLSRLQDNRIQLHPSVFDLSALIEVQMRKYDVYRMQEGFIIEKKLIGSACVRADQKRIEQVFNNFMTNAINYGGQAKHVIVRESIHEDSVRVEVQDFGEGIEEKDLPNIWDRYYKVDKKHVRVSNGSGIGLAIVKQVLDLHQAKYGVSSKKGEGSTFWFELPLAKEEKREA